MMLVRLLGRLDRTRFDSHIISLLPPGALAASLRAQGLPVSTLAMRRGLPSPIALVRLVARLRRLRPAILQTWMYHADVLGTIAASIAQVPALAWNIRASDVDMSQYGRLSGLTRRLGALLSRRPDLVIVNSEAGRRAHEALDFRPRRWEVVPNGVDVEEYRPDATRRAAVRAGLGIDASAFLIGLVARFDPMKDHETFLRAAGKLALEYPQVRFLLAGAGVDGNNRQLGVLITELGLGDRVCLLGVRHDIPALTSALDAAVMASAFGEGFPTVIAEAMACGVPGVVTDVGDAANLVGSTGMVVPPQDPDALAQALGQVMALPAEARAKLGQAARTRVVAEFSIERATAHYEALYRSLAPSEMTDARRSS